MKTDHLLADAAATVRARHDHFRSARGTISRTGTPRITGAKDRAGRPLDLTGAIPQVAERAAALAMDLGAEPGDEFAVGLFEEDGDRFAQVAFRTSRGDLRAAQYAA